MKFRLIRTGPSAAPHDSTIDIPPGTTLIEVHAAMFQDGDKVTMQVKTKLVGTFTAEEQAALKDAL